MDRKALTKEQYRATFDKFHAPEALLRKVETMQQGEKRQKKNTVLRRTGWAVAAVVALFALSNIAVFAATGEPWVAPLFSRNETTNQPHENIEAFFRANGDLFDSPNGTPKKDYYGGTYLDGSTQVILLTDLSRSDEFTQIGQNVRFEKCDYTYDELTRAIDEDFAKVCKRADSGDETADNIIAFTLDDKQNRVAVDVYHMTDEKVLWFKENISSAAYYVFCNADSFPELD